MVARIWDVTVFVEEESSAIYYVAVEAEDEEEAMRVAMAQVRVALAIIKPSARIIGARAEIKSEG